VLAVNQTSTDAKLNDTLAVVKVVHTLVNNEMGLALKDAAAGWREKANLSGREDDRAKAAVAEQRLKVYEDRQRSVDAGPTPPK
jgi:hypothetical protein